MSRHTWAGSHGHSCRTPQNLAVPPLAFLQKQLLCTSPRVVRMRAHHACYPPHCAAAKVSVHVRRVAVSLRSRGLFRATTELCLCTNLARTSRARRRKRLTEVLAAWPFVAGQRTWRWLDALAGLLDAIFKFWGDAIDTAVHYAIV